MHRRYQQRSYVSLARQVKPEWKELQRNQGNCCLTHATTLPCTISSAQPGRCDMGTSAVGLASSTSPLMTSSPVGA